MIVRFSTARAGNVIGGGDFAADRIIPDCIRAAMKKEDIIVRNPFSTRPYEHVLEPVVAYLMIAHLVTLFCQKWNEATGDSVRWLNKYDGGPHEANFLKLDCSKLKRTFGWSPRWNVETTMEKIVEWTNVYLQGGNVAECMEKQIREFIEK